MTKKEAQDYTKKIKTGNDVNIMEDIVSKESPKAAQAVAPKSKKVKDELTERFTARFTSQEWKYLQEKHWQTRTSVTDIIRDLVKADMKKHPEIVKEIDELNG